MARTIRVYDGGGALKMCALGVEHMLAEQFKRSSRTTHIRRIDEYELASRTAGWQDTTDLLVIGGGGVTGFKAALGDQGITAIKSYVQNGGKYLGLCAGAYFGAERIEFKGRDPKTGPYTKESPGLGFFNGLARGSLDSVAPSYDGTSATCAITDVLLCGADEDALVPFTAWAVQPSLNEAQTPSISPVFYGGGPEFKANPGVATHHVLSYYVNDAGGPARSVAGVMSDVGSRGGRAVLVSWHPELSPDFIKAWMSAGNDDEGRNRLALGRELSARSRGTRSPQEWLGKVLHHIV